MILLLFKSPSFRAPENRSNGIEIPLEFFIIPYSPKSKILAKKVEIPFYFKLIFSGPTPTLSFIYFPLKQ